MWANPDAVHDMFFLLEAGVVSVEAVMDRALQLLHNARQQLKM
jgi:hypothetical protein